MARKPGKTAEGHADRILAELYPGAPVARAVKALRWRFDPETRERTPFTVAEDLFGCLDRVVALPTLLLGVQVTSEGKRTARQRKVYRELIRPLLELWDGEPTTKMPYLRLEVWGWEPRRAMHRWRWSWEDREWQHVAAEPLRRAA